MSVVSSNWLSWTDEEIGVAVRQCGIQLGEDSPNLSLYLYSVALMACCLVGQYNSDHTVISINDAALEDSLLGHYRITIERKEERIEMAENSEEWDGDKLIKKNIYLDFRKGEEDAESPETKHG
jgi:hypothetical protein